MFKKKNYLLPDWPVVLKKARSLKWILASVFFMCADMIIPLYYPPNDPPPRVLVLCAVLSSIGGFISRLYAQNNIPKEDIEDGDPKQA